MRIIEANPNTPEAILLLEELSDCLQRITGDSGRNSFDANDVCGPRSLFVIAYSNDGDAIGCGGIRPIDENTAEVKRLFARVRAQGVGTAVLKHLEKHAHAKGYTTLWLETRLINRDAVSFYEQRGYSRIANYGKYAGNPEAVCFEKKL